MIQICRGCDKVFYPLTYEVKRGRGVYHDRRCADTFQKGTPLERFERFFEKTKKCWLWTGSIQKIGYGQFCLRNKKRHAHQVSWELYRGQIGEKWVLHSCDNKRCVNPDHLYLGTAKDNTRDMLVRHPKFRGIYVR